MLLPVDHSVSIGDLPLHSGSVLKAAEVHVQTWGSPTSPSVLVLHALTGNARPQEWWSDVVGRGKLIDPNRHYIISPNYIGSCYGSTGPNDIDPHSGLPYQSAFPAINIRDIALSIQLALSKLEITSISLAIGGSMGGMVALELGRMAPTLMQSIVAIATGASHTAWRIAFSSSIRKIIETLARVGNIEEGLRLARQIAMISYRSMEEFNDRFGRTLQPADNLPERFAVESYLEHQGDKIVNRFSPYSYLTLTRAMERYDLLNRPDSDRSVSSTLSLLNMPVLLVGITSDILYAETEIRELADALPRGEYRSLDAPFGHDSFLVAADQLSKLIAHFVEEHIFANDTAISELA